MAGHTVFIALNPSVFGAFRLGFQSLWDRFKNVKKQPGSPVFSGFLVL